MFLPLSLRLAVATATCALVFGVSTAAHAAEDDQMPAADGSAWSERRVAAHALLAFPGGPTGNLGIELDYSPMKQLGLTAGIGTSYVFPTNGSAARYALGARYRFFITDSVALGAGATFSTGEWRDQEFGLSYRGGVDDFLVLEHAAWAGAQISVEWRWGHFSFKGFSGAEVMVNASKARCYKQYQGSLDTQSPFPCAEFDAALPTNLFIAPFGVALGYAF